MNRFLLHTLLILMCLCAQPGNISASASVALSEAHGAMPTPAGTVLKGVVRDSVTHEPLGYVNIYVNSSKGGTITDEKGHFEFKTSQKAENITVSSLGYKTKTVGVTPRNAAKLKIDLAPADYQLKEIVVKPKKKKYSKKNNPAVEFMRKVRQHARMHDPTKQPWYSFDKQEKIIMGFSDFDSIIAKDDKKTPRSQFLNDYIERTELSDRQVLKFSIKERRVTELFGSEPDLHKEYTSAIRSTGLDNKINQANVQTFLNDLVRDVDVFDNDITLIQNRFVSPFSPISADYYMFFLDTVMRQGEKYIELSFAPKTPESISFNGKMYVLANDSSYTVRHLEMRVPKLINLNYLRDLYIEQDFTVDSLGNRIKTRDQLDSDFRIVGGTPALYVSKISVFDNHSYERRDDLNDIYKAVGEEHQDFFADKAPGEVWETDRKIPLTKAEESLEYITEKARKNPWFYYPEKVIGWLVNGYICTSKRNSKFDFGPITNFVSSNAAEGFRLQVGGMTTANLSRHWLARGYVAYGFRDHKVKYFAEGEYSFNPRKYHSREFPMHAIRVSSLYGIDQMGSRYRNVSGNILTMLKRAENYRVTYRNLNTIDYILELRNHLSFNITLRHERQTATKWLPFILSDGSHLKNYDQTSIIAEVRYAPGEKFIQGNTNRTHVNLDAPILTLRHEYGPKGLFNSRYNVNITTLSAKKRFWFSSFGYADFQIDGGKIWSSVDYPTLLWPAVNLSYTIQGGQYSLMNPMEFAMDQYASWDLTYCGNGILFNRIPGLNRLRLREIFNFKGVFGGLTRKNNPAYNKDLFPFPEDAKVSLLKPDKPYMECSAGIDNILYLLRVDYVWRLTYRNMPGIDRWGIRVGLHFAF